ncbi:MAG: hypothetical protein GXP40_11825 [Chloroflexi bacterium]|nr:hypothetical protein [Chloroflexota bacterium]
MKLRRSVFIAISVLLLASLACNLGVSAPTPPQSGEQVATSVALTLQAQGNQPPAAGEPPPATTSVPSITPTPTITLTPTPSIPMVSVSVDTNCRTGPGKIFDYVTALLVGEKAEVIGKNTPSNYWVIKKGGATCWLWGKYATVEGNVSAIPEMPSPPTPTPALPKAPKNFNVAKACAPLVPPQFLLTAILTWGDNSDNELGFRVYRDGAQIADLGPNVGGATDTFPVLMGVPVQYGVEAYNATGASARKTSVITCP